MANIIGPKANNQVNMSEVDMFVKFLSNPNTQIPVDSNFLIHFESLPPVFTDSKANPWVNFEENWDVKNVSRALIQEIQNQVHGPAGGQICLFANGINIPGESVGVERTDPLLGPAGGLVGGVTTNMRIKYSELTISFLETNKSFIDFVIRP